MSGFALGWNIDCADRPLGRVLRCLTGDGHPEIQETALLERGVCCSSRMATKDFCGLPWHWSDHAGRLLVMDGRTGGWPGPAASSDELTGWVDELIERPADVLRKLTGAFSLAAVSGRSVVLARDPLGLQRLYYRREGSSLFASSRIRGLLRLSRHGPGPDDDVMSSHAVFGYNVFPERTPQVGVSSVVPGCFVLARDEGAILVHRYADELVVPLQGEGPHPGAEELDAQVLAMLGRSVEEAMSSDSVRKGLFLSGGLDSSVLACLARSHQPHAFVLYDSKDLEDLHMARRVAQALGIDLAEVQIDGSRLAREIVHYLWHFESPVAAGAFDLLGGVAFHAVARNIARDHVVAVAGEGGDELFLGYHRLHMEPQRAASEIRKRAETVGSQAVQEFVQDLLQGNGPGDARALRRLALTTGMSEYHMASVLSTGAAFGLECRAPYLARDLTFLLASLDESCLIDREGRWTKLPLRRIARSLMEPHDLSRIWIRRKLAMPSAVQRAQADLVERLGDATSLASVLERLYRRFHLEEDSDECPDGDLFDFAATLSREEM